MVHPIVKFGDPLLETPAQSVTAFDDRLAKLISDMLESMYAAQGIGLAAPQIGVSQRVAVIDLSADGDRDAQLVLVNPEVLAVEGRQTLEEGCLSLPGIRELVTRPRIVTVRAQHARGGWFERTGEGLLAQALHHEIDHVEGKLFLAHLSALRRDLIKRRIRKLAREGQW